MRDAGAAGQMAEGEQAGVVPCAQGVRAGASAAGRPGPGRVVAVAVEREGQPCFWKVLAVSEWPQSSVCPTAPGSGRGLPAPVISPRTAVWVTFAFRLSSSSVAISYYSAFIILRSTGVVG